MLQDKVPYVKPEPESLEASDFSLTTMDMEGKTGLLSVWLSPSNGMLSPINPHMGRAY